MISSAAQLQAIISECHWPPRGRRGVGFQRANVFGKFFDAYVQEAQESLIIAQIEHIDAVNNLESIIAVEGLDAIMVGPYDLSASLGITGEFENKNISKRFQKYCRCVQSIKCHVVFMWFSQIRKCLSNESARDIHLSPMELTQYF